MDDTEVKEQCQPDDGMGTYIGCKVIKAVQMDECTFLHTVKGKDVTNRETRSGYKVMYPDGYTSWSPANVFEEAYRPINGKELAMCR